MSKEPREHKWAIGLMSGTSCDGIDAALIKTDGISVSEFGPMVFVEYEDSMRQKLKKLMRGDGDFLKIEKELTDLHGKAVNKLLKEAGFKKEQVSVIGFHGQTIAHRPADGITWQIGNGPLLAEFTGIDTVFDFRRKDMAAGGGGAPLVPVYHAALAKNLGLPAIILNIGGVANATWVSADNSEKVEGDELLSGIAITAFDVGPGNALIDDFVHERVGQQYDEGGDLALAGEVCKTALKNLLKNDFFAMPYPKSLDRNHFSLKPVKNLSASDGAATLAMFTAKGVEIAAKSFPDAPKKWLVTGGGRRNKAIMKFLSELLGSVSPVEEAGWNGDALEAQAFAFLAVRSKLGLALSLPTTTGVTRAVSGGVFCRA